MGASRPSCCQDTGVAFVAVNNGPTGLGGRSPQARRGRHADPEAAGCLALCSPGDPGSGFPSASLQVSTCCPVPLPQFASHQPQSVSIKAPLLTWLLPAPIPSHPCLAWDLAGVGAGHVVVHACTAQPASRAEGPVNPTLLDQFPQGAQNTPSPLSGGWRSRPSCLSAGLGPLEATRGRLSPDPLG